MGILACSLLWLSNEENYDHRRTRLSGDIVLAHECDLCFIFVPLQGSRGRVKQKGSIPKLM